MNPFLKLVIVLLIGHVLSLKACENAIAAMATQVAQERFENLQQLQLDTMTALSMCKNPQLETIKHVGFILSRGTTFPQLISRIDKLNSAYDCFAAIPGFALKLSGYLCNLNQKKCANAYWRELAFALELMLEENESVKAFDKGYRIATAGVLQFSLVTNKRRVCWNHDAHWPRVTCETNGTVIRLKQLFIEQRDFVDRVNRRRDRKSLPHVEYNVCTAHPLDKSWRRWFSQQNISTMRWAPFELTAFHKNSNKLRHQI